jgi:hypothetical protein
MNTTLNKNIGKNSNNKHSVSTNIWRWDNHYVLIYREIRVYVDKYIKHIYIWVVFLLIITINII